MMNRRSSPRVLSEDGEDEDDAVPRQPSALNISAERDYFAEILSPLSSVGDAYLSLRTTAPSGAVDVSEKGNSSGTKSDAMRLQDPRSCQRQEFERKREVSRKKKRNRTSEMHSQTERKRRDKIKAKLRALQELIPNSHKIMSGVALGQAPFMSPSALQCLGTPQFPPFLPSGPYKAMSLGFGMGMTSIACSIFRPPLLSSLSPLPATSLLPMPTLNPPIPRYRSPMRMHHMPSASSP